MIMLDADAALVRHHVDILGGIAQQMFLGDVAGMDSPEIPIDYACHPKKIQRPACIKITMTT